MSDPDLSEFGDWRWMEVPGLAERDSDDLYPGSWVSVYRGPSGTTYIRFVRNALATTVVAVSEAGTVTTLWPVGGTRLKGSARRAVQDHERKLNADLLRLSRVREDK